MLIDTITVCLEISLKVKNNKYEVNSNAQSSVIKPDV